MNQFLHRVAWWASVRRIEWLHALIYRYRCPYPLNGHNSARACFKAGECGCCNQGRFR